MAVNSWFYCDHCQRIAVLCGTCGNNTCNGGYGEVMGVEPNTVMNCPNCPDAYEMDRKGPPPDVWEKYKDENVHQS